MEGIFKKTFIVSGYDEEECEKDIDLIVSDKYINYKLRQKEVVLETEVWDKFDATKMNSFLKRRKVNEQTIEEIIGFLSKNFKNPFVNLI